MPMKSCPDCEKKVGPRTHLCPNCGHDFVAKTSATAAPPKKQKAQKQSNDETETVAEERAIPVHNTKRIDCASRAELTAEEFADLFYSSNNCTIVDGDTIELIRGPICKKNHALDDILPCHGLFPRVVIDGKAKSVSVWLGSALGEPNLVLENALK